MILNTTQTNPALLSNVGQIGEFRIRNSAKAFSILSSGLYANKIRAVIRELSCNAVDSHVAAGRAEAPFSVHLPNQLEPWFSVRDHGVGLSHEQVINIYTTYFESTKTASNEFIGALGLGSKSPFGYTENFTVTAVQNGRQGIYTAFINDQGVPSVALMTQTDTAEPNGVEVKFSVHDCADFEKFRSEAGAVYAWFKLQPTFTGTRAVIQPVEYLYRDLIAGVHQMKSTGRYTPSFAIMGNIAYPIDMPNSQNNLGDLCKLLECGLVMEFGIGELDFQASREGLSYIPQTIAAIGHKLASLNAQLDSLLTQEADAIDNFWQRIYYLRNQQVSGLWRVAAANYISKHRLSNFVKSVDISCQAQTIQERYNIVIRGLAVNWRGSFKTVAPDYYGNWKIPIDKDRNFVVSDIKQGAITRSKLFLRDRTGSVSYILEPHDCNQPMDLDGFMKSIQNPPADQIFKASEMPPPARQQRQQRNQNVTIMQLVRRSERRSDSAYHQRVWRPDSRPLSLFGQDTYFYVPLRGFKMITHNPVGSPANLLELMYDSGLFGSDPVTLYGVRKVDLAQVQQLSNWKNLEEYITENLTQIRQGAILNIVQNQVPCLSDILGLLRKTTGIDDQSPAAKLMKKFGSVPFTFVSKQTLGSLLRVFRAEQVQVTIDQECHEASCVIDRYPLLKLISRTSGDAIAEYINLVDLHRATK